MASNCSTGSRISTRSSRHPCGTKTPNRTAMAPLPPEIAFLPACSRLDEGSRRDNSALLAPASSRVDRRLATQDIAEGSGAEEVAGEVEEDRGGEAERVDA